MATAAQKKAAANKAAKSANTRNVPQTVPPQTTALAVTGLPAGLVAVKRVTMPSLVLKIVNDTRVLNIVDAFRTSKVPGKVDPKTGVAEKPAIVCTVGDVLTGEMFTLLVPSVVQSNLENEYPDAGYVGRVFALTNKGKREGKRHVDFEITEVDASALTAAAKAAQGEADA